MFSKRLKQLRKEENLTQQDLAEKLSLSASTIGMYEQGRREPDTETLLKLSKYFNVSVDYLLGINDSKQICSNGVIKVENLDFPEEIMKEMTLFFMNGEIAEKDKEKVMRDIQELYWKAKDKFSENNK